MDARRKGKPLGSAARSRANPTTRRKASPFRAHPLTRDRWADLTRLFGKRGAYGGCWCMYWRIPRAQFTQQSGAANRRAFQRTVRSGLPTGLIGYLEGDPVGWIAVGPRETLPTLARSPVLRPLDEKPVWAITCFYVAVGYRGQGLALRLIDEAVRYVRKSGGRCLEAYPTDPKGRKLPPVSSYMGTPSLFRRAGFREVARPSQVRVIMRKAVRP